MVAKLATARSNERKYSESLRVAPQRSPFRAATTNWLRFTVQDGVAAITGGNRKIGFVLASLHYDPKLAVSSSSGNLLVFWVLAPNWLRYYQWELRRRSVRGSLRNWVGFYQSLKKRP